MQNISFETKAINVELLDETIRASLGERIFGISQSEQEIMVHLSDEANARDVAQVREIFEAHDATHLTNRQQEQQNNRLTLTQLREENSGLFDLSTVGNERGPIREMAKRLAQLELEVMEMRGELGSPSFSD
ncbi:MAG: hypothetical protein KC708_17155 [Anaerolineae bacterium]|nr:hypothetical protein [Anaerolineae bacterium]